MPGGSFPTDNKPLEAFGYSLSPSFGQPDFVLVNGKPVWLTSIHTFTWA